MRSQGLMLKMSVPKSAHHWSDQCQPCSHRNCLQICAYDRQPTPEIAETSEQCTLYLVEQKSGYKLYWRKPAGLKPAAVWGWYRPRICFKIYPSHRREVADMSQWNHWETANISYHLLNWHCSLPHNINLKHFKLVTIDACDHKGITMYSEIAAMHWEILLK